MGLNHEKNAGRTSRDTLPLNILKIQYQRFCRVEVAECYEFADAGRCEIRRHGGTCKKSNTYSRYSSIQYMHLNSFVYFLIINNNM